MINISLYKGIDQFGKAYSAHAILEVYRNEVWGAVDPLTKVIYRNNLNNPVSVWELMNNKKLIKFHYKGEATPYTTVSLFSGVAITNYYLYKCKNYNYSISRINEYYRSILRMSEKGWPGGLRWIHGEDD